MGLLGEHVSVVGQFIATVTAAIAASLDGIDGWLARSRHTASDFGARFDMETDAVLILALAALAWQFDKAGVWVLLSGSPALRIHRRGRRSAMDACTPARLLQTKGDRGDTDDCADRHDPANRRSLVQCRHRGSRTAVAGILIRAGCPLAPPKLRTDTRNRVRAMRLAEPAARPDAIAVVDANNRVDSNTLRSRWRWLSWVIGLLLLNAFVTFHNVWPTLAFVGPASFPWSSPHWS
ncbi:MAG: CDP-alcohol phosphatidyltransferase family protein [Gammaproteobacteria bacterium]